MNKKLIILSLFLLVPLFISCGGDEGSGASTVADHSLRRAIARFDVVPYQIISEPFNVGVLAYHKNGIESVLFEITDGNKTEKIQSDSASLNPRTNVEEHWFTLNPEDFQDGPITIKATVNPISALTEKRDLSLVLFTNSQGTYSDSKTVYVSPTAGLDTNDGSISAPFETINQGIYSMKNQNQGTIVLLEEGIYILQDFVKANCPLSVDNYITIKSADGLDKNNVIIGRETRDRVVMYTSKVHWKGVTIDFKNIIQIYNDTGPQWFDNCRWFSSDGWAVRPPDVRPPISGEYYATDSLAEDMVYGFTKANLIRGGVLQKISGDVLQNAKLVINTKIYDIDGNILPQSIWHTDIYQLWGETDNIILLNVTAERTKNEVQTFYLRPTTSITDGDPQVALSNMAVINCEFYNYPLSTDTDPNYGAPPYTQFTTKFEHILFRNVKIPWQQIWFRTDTTGPQRWNASDIIFENCLLHYRTYRKYVTDEGDSYYVGPPSGVKFINCSSAGLNYQ